MTREREIKTGIESHRLYVVLRNDEEQYSIWPGSLEVPAGWRFAGKRGNWSECLAFIDEAWRDMRPLSLRRRMDALK
jgi:MbtH protein